MHREQHLPLAEARPPGTLGQPGPWAGLPAVPAGPAARWPILLGPGGLPPAPTALLRCAGASRSMLKTCRARRASVHAGWWLTDVWQTCMTHMQGPIESWLAEDLDTSVQCSMQPQARPMHAARPLSKVNTAGVHTCARCAGGVGGAAVGAGPPGAVAGPPAPRSHRRRRHEDMRRDLRAHACSVCMEHNRFVSAAAAGQPAPCSNHWCLHNHVRRHLHCPNIRQRSSLACSASLRQPRLCHGQH